MCNNPVIGSNHRLGLVYLYYIYEAEGFVMHKKIFEKKLLEKLAGMRIENALLRI